MMERFWRAPRPLRVGTIVAGMALLAGCQPMALTLQPSTEQVAPSEAAQPVMPPSAAKASMIAPIVEKRETISATGYAVISVQSHKLPAQQRLMAIRDRKSVV